MHFSLVKLTPGACPSPAGFDDAILPLYFALRELGFEAEVRVNSLHPTARNILFGANQYRRLPLEHIPRGSIIFNLEQLSSGDIWFTPHYVRMLREFQVWDYSRRNCEGLKERFGIGAQHVRLGYMPEMTRIVSPARASFDALFYGFPNKRRLDVLKELQQFGTRLFLPSCPLMGRERDRAIAHSTLVLNIHYYTPATLEMVRLGYLWANRKAVISECGPDTEIPPGLETACTYCRYEDLVPGTQRLLRDADTRQRQAEKGFRAFSAVSQADVLREILGTRKYPTCGAGVSWATALNTLAGDDGDATGRPAAEQVVAALHPTSTAHAPDEAFHAQQQ